MKKERRDGMGAKEEKSLAAQGWVENGVRNDSAAGCSIFNPVISSKSHQVGTEQMNRPA